MSLSKEKHDGRKLNIIKMDSSPAKLKIVDYKSFLEEIEVDSKLKFDFRDLMDKEKGEDIDEDLDRVNGNGNGGSPRNEVTTAFEEGFEAGKNEATTLLQVEYDKKVGIITSDFTSMAHELALEMEKYNKEFDKAVVKLALAVARRVVVREIDLDEAAVLSRSREAIRKIIGVERIKIHVNPADEEYIREHRNELSNYADSVKEISVEADNKVERGGCVIESELGNIDARISTQFELIEEAFLELAK